MKKIFWILLIAINSINIKSAGKFKLAEFYNKTNQDIEFCYYDARRDLYARLKDPTKPNSKDNIGIESYQDIGIEFNFDTDIKSLKGNFFIKIVDRFIVLSFSGIDSEGSELLCSKEIDLRFDYLVNITLTPDFHIEMQVLQI